MNIYILNGNLEKVAVIDEYSSLIWTKRYYEAGDFELYVPVKKELLEYIAIGNYVIRDDDDKVMLIQHIEIDTNAESGNYFIIRGKSIEILLARRIIAQQTNINGHVEAAIQYLINQNCISPESVVRTIPKIRLGAAQGYTDAIQVQVSYENLYEYVVQLCKTYKIGWKMVLDGEYFVFRLYKGTDHSYSQTENPFVVFSPDYDNLINSHYMYDTSNFANVAYVGGEGEGTERKTSVVGGSSAGMNRYEIFVDARDISSNDGAVNIAVYLGYLSQRGREKLAEHSKQQTFDGEIANTTFKYKTDWDVGDIVQIENECGITAAPRIIEVIESHSSEGFSFIPTFEEWEVS